MKTRPWFVDPRRTCAVLDRIADRLATEDREVATQVLTAATQRIWDKQAPFCDPT